MFALYIFALLINTAFSSTPCEDGVETVSKVTKNPADIIGNWTFVYHWEPQTSLKQAFIEDGAGDLKNCPEISITAVTSELAEEKEAECKDLVPQFKWSDAKLRVDAPLMHMNGGIIFIGEKDNWLFLNCHMMVRVEIRKVSDDYMLMTNSEVPILSELLARKVPTKEELKCISHNIDIEKGVKGIGLCY